MANSGLIFSNFYVIFKNFLKKRGVPTPGTPQLDLPMLGMQRYMKTIHDTYCDIVGKLWYVSGQS